MKLKVGDKVSVFNYWHKNEKGTVVEIDDRKVHMIGPFVRVQLDNGESTGIIPEIVCTLINNKKIQIIKIIKNV